MPSVSLPDPDQQAIERLIIEASYRIDHGLADSLFELFTADASLTFGDLELHGREAIAEWGRNRVKRGGVSRHIISNSRFSDATSDRVHAVSLVTAFISNVDPPAPALPSVVGEYHDTFVRDQKDWLFASRTLSVLFVGSPH